LKQTLDNKVSKTPIDTKTPKLIFQTYLL
jgi:hypothetical protein